MVQHHRILREALQHAVRWQIIARNPADAVEPPKPDRKEMQVLSEEQIQRLLAVTRDSRFYLPCVIAVTTGLRRGEILGLRWGDVNLGEGILAVRRTLEHTSSSLTFKEPKNGKSRVVVLPTTAVTALEEHRKTQSEDKLLRGSDYQDQDLICAQSNGWPVPPDNFSSDFKKYARRAGIPNMRFHDLRHTHATLLLGKGIHPKVVSERLGHSTISITMDVYSHVLPSMQEEAARRIDDVFGVQQALLSDDLTEVPSSNHL